MDEHCGRGSAKNNGKEGNESCDLHRRDRGHCKRCANPPYLLRLA